MLVQFEFYQHFTFKFKTLQITVILAVKRRLEQSKADRICKYNINRVINTLQNKKKFYVISVTDSEKVLGYFF